MRRSSVHTFSGATTRLRNAAFTSRSLIERSSGSERSKPTNGHCPIRRLASSPGHGRDRFRSDGTARAIERFRWLENELAACRLPTMIVWGREDDVFDRATFSTRFKQIVAHAEGPHLVTGRHFLQEDSGPEIAALIVDFLARNRTER